MTAEAKDLEERHGSLVAVEGDSLAVSTQLRLLPPSSKILILPSLDDDIIKQSDETPFNARAFVRNVHTAFATRAETARSFLRSSTSDQPRLVFMNGGCVGARTTCITNICENITNGEIREAEKLFSEIVKDGVAGLMAAEVAVEPFAQNVKKVGNKNEQKPHQSRSSSLSAGAAAMEAADTLDQNTAHLQSSEETMADAGPIVEGKHSDSSGVSKDLAEHGKGISQTSESAVTDASQSSAGHINAVVEGQQSSTAERAKALLINGNENAVRQSVIDFPHRSHSLDGQRGRFTVLYGDFDDEDLEDLEDDVPLDDSRWSIPPTPGAGPVVFGEACIVDIQSARSSKRTKRIHSLDRVYRKSASLKPRSPLDAEHGMKSAISHQNLRSGRAIMDDEARERSESQSSYETLPRTAFVKASETTIRRSPTLKRLSDTLANKSYIDKGTDAHPLPTPDSEQAAEELFEPVFPLIEDLVIHYAGGNGHNNEIFNEVVRSYKNGSYPVLPSSKIEANDTIDSVQDREEKAETKEARPFSHITAETYDDGYHRRQEVDPYNPDSYNTDGQQMWSQPRQTKKFAHVSMAEPPTPATTPPPITTANGQKFHEFSPVNSNSAIGIHNSLRSILNIHFGPPEVTNYRQYDTPLDHDRLWKPVFRNDDGQGNEGRTVDQIIALGCEEGVGKDFFNEISGQIEKLGTKKSGISRTGKLDIRYLVATAMQAHTSLPLTQQSGANPFTNPLSLATSLVSPLETYLSINSCIRLLVLTYPASHLGTVLALRKVLGSDLIKVSGIIDALASDPPSFSRASSPTPPNPLSNEGVASLNHRPKLGQAMSSFSRTRAELARQAAQAQNYSIARSGSSKHASLQGPGAPSFAKANFVLPSTATDAEISSFLSGIWKCLIEKSNWYTPESETETVDSMKPNLPMPPPIPATPATQTAEFAPRSPITTFSPGSSVTASTPERKTRTKSLSKSSKIDQILGAQASAAATTGSLTTVTSSIPTTNSRSTTLSSTFGSSNTVSSGTANGLPKSRSELERINIAAWEKADFGGEGDSDDEIDRMLMPRLPPKLPGGVKKKGNSRKALKWLGLA